MIQEIADRLASECPSLVSGGTAEDLDALDRGTAPRNGTVFVIPFSDQAGDNTLGMGAVRQRVEVYFLIALIVRRHDDAKGGKRSASYDLFKREITTAVLGWKPPDASDPIQYVSSRAVPRGNGVTLHVQTWKTAQYIRSSQ